MADLDLDFYENVIIHNALKNDLYLGSIVEHIDGAYFNNSDIASIFNLIKDHYLTRNKIPNTTEIKAKLISPELKKSFINVLTKIKGLDKDYDNDELIENTQSFLKQRAVYQAVMETAEGISKGNNDTGVILNAFEEACGINLFQDFGLDIINDPNELARRLKEESAYISTGYKWLDNMIKGFCEQGRALYVISAATNVGKSIMLTNIGCNVARQNKKVALFTMEMSEEMYGKRAASCITQLGIGDIELYADEMVQSIDDIKTENPRSNFWIKEFPTKGASVSTLRAYLKKLIHHKKCKPDLIIVDYLNLMVASSEKGDSYSDVKKLTEELRGLSYEFGGIPILTATQLNRDAVNEVNPGLETTSESMGLSMTADVQISLWANDEDKEAGILHMGMQKNRFGPNFGKTALKIDWNNLSVVETEDSIFDNEDLQSAKSILDDL